jgi:Virulence factor
MKIFLPTAVAMCSALMYHTGTERAGSHPYPAMSKSDIGRRGLATINRATEGRGITRVMAEVTVVYWRDIPAQVIVGKGRKGSKVQLSERFEQAIDRCAMKVGARDTDSYLAEWRKAVVHDLDGEPDEIARSEAARLEAEFDSQRLKALIDSEGWAKA